MHLRDLTDISRAQVYLGGILFFGLLVRILLFNHVSINYDTGYYLYDAYLINRGGIPIVDYYSRSPLFHYLLAGVLSAGFDPLSSARSLMIVTSTGLAAAVFVLAKRLHSTRAGLVSSALFISAPLTVVWGQWVKTEQVAAIVAILAMAVYLPYIRNESVFSRRALIFGMLLGIGFLIRRVTVIHAVGVSIFIIYSSFQQDSRIRPSIGHPLIAAVGMLGTILSGYIILSGGNIAAFRLVLSRHFFTLIPINEILAIGLMVRDGPMRSIAIFDTLFFFCTNCGPRTRTITSEVMFVILPAVTGFWFYYRNIIYSRVKEENARQAYLSLLLLAAVFVVYMLQTYSVWLLVATAIGVCCVGTFLYMSRVIIPGLDFIANHRPKVLNLSWFAAIELFSALLILTLWGDIINRGLNSYRFPMSLLYISVLCVIVVIILIMIQQLGIFAHLERKSPGIQAVAVVTIALVVSYLYRDRVIFVGYFQDIYPFVSVIVGVRITNMIEGISTDTVSERFSNKNPVCNWSFPHAASVVVAFVVIITITLPGALYINASHGGLSQPYDPSPPGTVTAVQAVGSDLSERTAGKEMVFTAVPIYALEANLSNAGNLSRSYWPLVVTPDTELAESIKNKIINDLRSGRVSYVIIEPRMERIFNTYPEIEALIESNYCRVESGQSTYGEVRAHLYKLDRNEPTC